MSEIARYHYVYRITSIEQNKHYYGVRTSTILPCEDLGINYFSSSHNTDFIKDQKINTKAYKYKVIKIFKDRLSAAKYEMLLHDKFDVAVNPNFYNMAKHTSTGFDVTGLPKSEETKRKLSKAHTGKVLTEDHKKKISDSHKGLKQSEETKCKRKLSYSGNKVYNSKLANIYNYKTNQLIAKEVVISEWAKLNGYNQGNLTATTRADRDKPSSTNNRHHCKSVFAKYP